ncbi:C40 family peptidase [Streptomyces goshikiensis]|uniref:C40 family peptidase n=1 Tax=Streptomyces goshikiensis TaxID=1942 RepID=UPI00366139D5
MDPPDPTLPRAPPPPSDRTGVGPVAGEGDRVHTQLPRTAAAQYETTAHRPVSRGELLPGDRLFWAHRNGSIYHVGLYAGSGRVLHAPRTGCTVEVAPVDSAMPAADYRGATRPDPPKEIQLSVIRVTLGQRESLRRADLSAAGSCGTSSPVRSAATASTAASASLPE